MTDESRLLRPIAPSQQENLDALAQRGLPADIPADITVGILRYSEDEAWLAFSNLLVRKVVARDRGVIENAARSYRAAIEARVRAESAAALQEAHEREAVSTSAANAAMGVADEYRIRAEATEERRSIASQLGAIYDHALIMARGAAYGCGYAIAVHGSEMRDLDLIAVPWTDEATDAETLVEAIIRMTRGRHGDKSATHKPHGRRSWTIHLNNEHTLGNFKPVLPYIDLSVMPRAESPASNGGGEA